MWETRARALTARAWGAACVCVPVSRVCLPYSTQLCGVCVSYRASAVHRACSNLHLTFGHRSGQTVDTRTVQLCKAVLLEQL